MKQTTFDPFRQMCQDVLAETDSMVSGALGASLKDRLLSHVDIRPHPDAPEWVVAEIENLLGQECRRRMVNEIKVGAPGIVIVSRNGDVIRLPGVNGVPTAVVYGDNEDEISRFIQRELVVMEMPQLLYVHNELERHTNRVSQTTRVVRFFIALLQQYPAARTPDEACQLANIDPRRLAEELVTKKVLGS